jgi:outer membrane protein assembly factor BamB
MRLWLTVSLVLLVGAISPAGDWPAWRGPEGQGHSPEKSLPVQWSKTDNVRWKIPLPDEGNSTPIIAGQRIFLTQATNKGTHRALYCLDRGTGKTIWTKEIVYKEKEPTHATNPFCSASPVTDGERVVVSHGSAGMYCYDFSGKQLWHKETGKQHHIWGNASSPILHRDLAILWCGPGDRQFLLAVNKKTGETVWQHDEPGGSSGNKQPWIGSWSTPIIVRVGDRDELLLGVPGKFKGFDPATGKERWSCAGLVNKGKDELVYTSPVAAHGIAVAMAGYGGGSVAVRLGGTGDITSTHRPWHQPPGNPQRIGSPVVVAEHLYIVNEVGQAQCFDLKTGKEAWRRDRALGSTWGSLVAADGKLFVTSRTGDTLVFAANPKKFEQLAKNSLGEPVYASIAVSDGELFIRSYKHLWCIGVGK